MKRCFELRPNGGTSTENGFIHYIYDIDSLEDLVLGFTNNNDESKRIAKIASQMILGDIFITRWCLIRCIKEE